MDRASLYARGLFLLLEYLSDFDEIWCSGVHLNVVKIIRFCPYKSSSPTLHTKLRGIYELFESRLIVQSIRTVYELKNV